MSGIASTTYLPNDANISQSDYCAIATKNTTKVSLIRPIVDGQDYEFYNPGARIARFRTDSSYMGIRLNYTELYTRTDTYNATGWILVDGVEFQSFSQVIAPVSGVTTSQLIEVVAGKQWKTIEVIMPHGISVDFVGVDLEAGCSIAPAESRTGLPRYVAIGDSITHGYTASSVIKTWPYLLAKMKNWQLINVGYGGRPLVIADGTVLGNQNPDVASYLIGYNNFVVQTALATFKSNYITFINNFRAVKPLVKLYCITPTWTANTNTLTPEMYRQQIRDALTTLANPLNILVEGLTLATNNVSSFTPDPHPNDVGSLEVATALSALVSL